MTITIHAENASELLAELRTLGLTTSSTPPVWPASAPADVDAETRQQTTAPLRQQTTAPLRPEMSEGEVPPTEQPSASATEEVYGGAGKTRNKNAEKLRDEILARVEAGQPVDDSQIARLPEKHQKTVQSARHSATTEPAAQPAQSANEDEISGAREAAAEDAANDKPPQQAEGSYTRDDIKSEIVRIHQTLGDAGLPRAKAAIEKHGNGATKQSNVPDDCIDAVVAALKEIVE